MMKKLIIFFCGTLALTACGNGIEKKANEKLTIARAAYERGDYEEAKTQIDSIKILYPKAFEARKAGQELMLDVELKAQQEILAFLDSALQAKQAAFDAIKGKYTLEKDAEYNLTILEEQNSRNVADTVFGSHIAVIIHIAFTDDDLSFKLRGC